MFRNFLVVLALLCASAIPRLVVAQTLTSITPDSANVGDTLNVTILGSNADFFTATSTTFEHVSSGFSITTQNDQAVSADEKVVLLEIPNNATTGFYNVTSNGPPDATMASGFFIGTCVPTCVHLSGEVFNDLNGNGVQDAGENGLEDIIIELNPGQYRTTTNAAGFWEIYPPNNTTYTVEVITPYYDLGCTQFYQLPATQTVLTGTI